MLPRACAIVVVLAGCGRLGFEPFSHELPDAPDAGDAGDGGDAAMADPNLQVQVQFEGAIVDVAKGRSVSCVGSCPVLETGRTSIAATFDGTQCLTIPSAPALQTQTFTLAVWFRSTQAREMTLFSKPYQGETTFENSWELFRTAPGNLSFATSGVVFTDAGIANDQVWHHVAVTYSTGAVSTFLDGVQETTATAPTLFDVDALLIGCDRDTAVYHDFFIGQLDDVRLYDRALSAAEIAALAQ